MLPTDRESHHGEYIVSSLFNPRVRHVDSIAESENPLSHSLSQQGQSMVEYLVVIALIAVVGIGAFTHLGQSIHVAAVESVQGITNNSN